MEKAAEKREDMRKTEQDRSRRRPERRDGNTGRGRAEGYGARKEVTGRKSMEDMGRQPEGSSGNRSMIEAQNIWQRQIQTEQRRRKTDGSLRGAMPCSKRSVPARRLTVC